MTEQRRLIYSVLCEGKHMTAAEIYTAAKEKMPKLALGTVYRNLTLMELDGQIRRIHIDGCSDVFDYTSVPHSHFVCIECGHVEDVQVELPTVDDGGRRIISREMTVKCICLKCQNKLKYANKR